MASENFTIQPSPTKKGVGKQVPSPADRAMTAQPASSALPSQISPQDEAFLEEMGVDPLQVAAELDGSRAFAGLPYEAAFAALTSPTTADFHPATLPKAQPSASLVRFVKEHPTLTRWVNNIGNAIKPIMPEVEGFDAGVEDVGHALWSDIKGAAHVIAHPIQTYQALRVPHTKAEWRELCYEVGQRDIFTRAKLDAAVNLWGNSNTEQKFELGTAFAVGAGLSFFAAKVGGDVIGGVTSTIGRGAGLASKFGRFGLFNDRTAKGLEDTIDLYRAVSPPELAQIRRTGLFENPFGILGKYFSTDLEGVKQYAEMAEKAFNDAPYTFVKTSIPKNIVTDIMKANVDNGIDSIVVPTAKLTELSEPELFEITLENRSISYDIP